MTVRPIRYELSTLTIATTLQLHLRETFSMQVWNMARLGLALLLVQMVGGRPSLAMQLVPAMFMLGDSLLDVGTNSYIPGCRVTANFGPYGESYFNPPTGRFSDGLLIPDMLAQLLGLPSFAPPYIQPGASYANGINFASAGAGLLPGTRADELVISIDRQIQQFLAVKPQLQSQYGSSFISRSIFLLSGGGNDVGEYLGNTTTQSTTPINMLFSELLQKLQFNVQTLYYAGARKIVIMLLSPLGCLPFVRAKLSVGVFADIPGCVEFVNLAVTDYNSQAADLINDMRLTFSDLNVIYVDPYSMLHSYIDQGVSNGFTQGSMACCGFGQYNGEMQCGLKDKEGHLLTSTCSKEALSSYVFFDNFHPTEAVYHLLVSAAYSGGNQSISHPVDIKTLASL